MSAGIAAFSRKWNAARSNGLRAACPRRLPPMLLSALGLISMAGAGIAFAAFRWNDGLAAAGVVTALAANWAGDSLDGTVARVRRIERPRYGYYVDHVIDLAGITFLFGGLRACSGLMSPLLAVVVLAAYLLVSAEVSVGTHSTGVFRMSFFGFGPTELRIVLAGGAIKAVGGATVTVPGFAGLQLFDAGAIVAIAGLVAAFVVSAVRNTRGLYAAEPVRRPGIQRAA